VSRAVIFDLDDTLIVEEATARASLREEAALLEQRGADELATVVLGTARSLWRSHPSHALCLALGIASWEGLWATFEGCHMCVDGVRAWAPTYRRRTWSSALAAVGVHDDALARAMSDAYVNAQRRGHPTIDGAGDAVRSLRGRCPLALLTNGPSDVQRHKLASTGLGDCFDIVVISGELGIGKPDPRAFLHASEAIGLPPSEVVMVRVAVRRTTDP
jgi:putative hydrolase of the HAD superfamily